MIACVIALIFNIGLLLVTNHGEYYTAKEYQGAYQDIEVLPDKDKANFIEQHYEGIFNSTDKEQNYSASAMGEMELFGLLRNQWNRITSYPKYLQSIKQSGEDSDISIFQNQSDFQKRNAEKTIKDYQVMEDVELTFTNVNTYEDAVGFASTDLFALALIFFVIVTLLVYEKEHHLFFLLKPTKEGRAGLICAKIGVILTITVFIALLLWGSNILVSLIKNGSIPTSISLQSITSFTKSTLRMTTGQYLFLFLFAKIGIYALLSMIFLFIALKSKRTVGIYIGSLLVLGISLVLYLTISNTSAFVYLKQINIITYLLVNPVFQTYLNLNMFGFPISITHIFGIVLPVSILFFIMLNIYVFSKDKTSDTISGFHFRRKNVSKINVSIFRHEAYKLLIMQKGLVILAIFSIAVSCFIINSNHDKSTDEYYYQSYMKVLEGPYTQKKQRIVEKEIKRFEELQQQRSNAEADFQANKISEAEKNAIDSYIGTQSISEQAFTRVLERVDYVTQHPEYPIIYESGYLDLFGMNYMGYRTDFILGLFLILTLIILCTSFLTNEYSTNMVSLINVQKNGVREVWKRKLILCIIMATICTFIAYSGQLFIIIQQYGLSNLNAMNLAIPELSTLSVHIPLIFQILLLYAIRLFMAYICVGLIFIVSSKLKNTYTTLSILCVLLALPLGITLIGVPLLDYISLNSFFSGNMLINEFSFIHIIIILVFISVIILLSKIKK